AGGGRPVPRRFPDPAPAARLQHRHGVLAAEVDTADVGREDALVLLLRELPERDHPVREAGVVDEDVETTEARRRLRDHRLHVARARDVGADEASRAALLGDRRGNAAAFRLVHVGDHHTRTLAREARRDRLAEPRAAAGDDGDLSVESHARTPTPGAKRPSTGVGCRHPCPPPGALVHRRPHVPLSVLVTRSWRRPLTMGLLLTVVCIAFEGLAVTTV